MSGDNFTDEKPRVATEDHCKLPWDGVLGGKRFRCHLCGHKFVPGDVWRFVFSKSHLNPRVCAACDGPDVLERWDAQNEELKTVIRQRFWWALDD